VTCISETHVLRKRANGVHISELLKHEFISLPRAIFGRVARPGSSDGWRDDVHPRQITYVTENAELIIQIPQRGLAVGYLPEYWAKRYGLTILKVEGCDFSANMEIFVATKNHKELGWLDV
jgi:DNA-binding transcriptional LysR family regulator